MNRFIKNIKSKMKNQEKEEILKINKALEEIAYLNELKDRLDKNNNGKRNLYLR